MRSRRGPGTGRTYAVAGACVVAIVALLVLGATAQRGLPGRSYYDVTAEFANASNLGSYAEVRIAGRRVGQVTDVTPHSGHALVRLQLDDDVRPLRDGATARIRLKGLLGAKFVELSPSTHGRAVPDGGVLPVSRTSSAVELFDVFGALDRRRRVALGATIRGLGDGLLGRGPDLNDALGRFPPALRDLTLTARAIVARRGAAERLIPALDAAAAAVDPVRDDLADGWDPQARALRPFGDRAAAVDAALVAAPPALEATRSGLADTAPLLRQTARLARAAVPMTRPLPEALTRSAALLRDGRRPLATAATLLMRARAAVAPTLALSRRLDPLVAPVSRVLTTSLPVLSELERRRCDLLGYVRNWRGMLAWGVPSDDPIGPLTAVRTTLVASAQLVGDLPVKVVEGVGTPPPYCKYGPVQPLGKTVR